MKTLDSLGALFLDARDGVRRLGRGGGLLLLGLALLFGGGCVGAFVIAAMREAQGIQWRVAELRGFGLLLAAIGLAFLVGGLRQLVSPQPPRGAEFPPLPAEELLAAARTTLRPYYVCISCRRIWTRAESVGRCPQCDSAADCLEIKSDGDLKMVEAALK